MQLFKKTVKIIKYITLYNFCIFIGQLEVRESTGSIGETEGDFTTRGL